LLAKLMLDVLRVSSIRSVECQPVRAAGRDGAPRAAQREASSVERCKVTLWLRSSSSSSAAGGSGGRRAGRAQQHAALCGRSKRVQRTGTRKKLRVAQGKQIAKVRMPQAILQNLQQGRAGLSGGLPAGGDSAQLDPPLERRARGVTPPAKLIHGYGRASTYPRCSSRFCRGRSHCCSAAASQSA